MTILEKLIKLITEKKKEKFSGKIVICFNSGGIVGIKTDTRSE